MKAKVIWQKELQFVGTADSGFPVKLDSHSSTETGVGPMEMVAIALAGCTAMDVISILVKKKMDVTGFEVKVNADRAGDHPKRFTKAALEYVVRGHGVDEAAVRRAIELSVTKYCSVHAMLKSSFPIALTYSIYEADKLVKEGTYQH
ncbi:MAG TPA: OsmC family protein [Anaerolineales bacterium]|nr:OsmC family protein [Anaerolineales bacterium]